jgi:hypothetical protein
MTRVAAGWARRKSQQAELERMAKQATKLIDSNEGSLDRMRTMFDSRVTIAAV